ncbi:MAG: hypothetical protein BWY02_01959 [bacterium ADurb.Bin157]|nr:MAG: hypothetical protein BWY02_01959 [bacterium ADurb.Bin157]
MKKDKEQLLRDPEIQPTADVIAKALGDANNAFIEFTDELKKHDIQLAWRYYTDGKSWLGKGLYKWTGKRGGKNENTVFWLSIRRGLFIINVYVPAKMRDDVFNLPIEDGEVKNIIEYSKQMGKLKFFPLTFELQTNKAFKSLFKLISFMKFK